MYDMKTKGLKQFGFMALIKNKILIGTRKDFLKKMGHEKNINLYFMGNACKHVMTYAKNVTRQMTVRGDLIAARICLSG